MDIKNRIIRFEEERIVKVEIDSKKGSVVKKIKIW
jgi:hypothetical protein